MGINGTSCRASFWCRLPSLLLTLLLTVQAARADVSDADREQARQRDRDGEIRYERWQRDQVNNAKSNSSDQYAAIAYSPSSGKYGYSFNYDSVAVAKREALARCKEPNAENVVWVKNGYCALAAGSGTSYGWGHGSTAAIARDNALSNCRKHSSDARILVCVYSGR